MEDWRLGGYYLINGPSDWWRTSEKQTIPTVGCVRDQIFGSWCYKWQLTTRISQENNLIKQKYKLTDKKFEEIQDWTTEKIENGKLDWGCENFPDLIIAQQFKSFFTHLPDPVIYSMYVAQADAEHLTVNYSEPCGLIKTLLANIPEGNNTNETFLGFDILDIEDSYLHSIYCHKNVPLKIMHDCGLAINANVLFEEKDNWTSVRKYLDEMGCNLGLQGYYSFIAKLKQC